MNKFCCWLLTSLIGWTTVRAETNYVINGNFEEGILPWYGQKRSADMTVVVPAPEMISHEKSDTWNGSAGALRATITRDLRYTYHSHVSGALCKFHQVAPSGSVLQISFAAKSLSGGMHLSVSRTWGGGSVRTMITPTWQQYRLELPVHHHTSGIAFSLVPSPLHDIQSLVDGEFLLDNVTVTVAAPQSRLPASQIPSAVGLRNEGTSSRSFSDVVHIEKIASLLPPGWPGGLQRARGNQGQPRFLGAVAM